MRKFDWALVAELRWAALFAGLAVAAMLGTELTLNDLLGSKADRSPQDALASMVSLAMLLGLVAALSAALVLAPTQILLAALRRQGLIAAALAIPAGALLTWYAFDRILPLDVNLGFNGLPALSGPQALTWPRYVSALGFQIGVGAFSLFSLHLHRHAHERARMLLILAIAIAALVFGMIWGDAMAELHPPGTSSPVNSTP